MYINYLFTIYQYILLEYYIKYNCDQRIASSNPYHTFLLCSNKTNKWSFITLNIKQISERLSAHKLTMVCTQLTQVYVSCFVL